MVNQLSNISIKVQRHIFSVYRLSGIRVAVPMFLLFGIIDYLYRPDLIHIWLPLRFFFAISFLAGMPLLKRGWFRKKYSQHLIAFQQFVACSIINIMIYQSGGFESFYLIGLILTSLIAINIFKISPQFTLVSLIFSYGPTMAIIAHTAGPDQKVVSALYLFYFASLILLNYIFSRDSFIYLLKGASKEIDLKTQLARYQRSEILKKQFPESLRKIIDSGDDIPQRKFIANAVVGFADITNSSRLTNQIGLQADWQLKETFIRTATTIATQHDFVVLTQLGDGFLFLANYEESNNWHFNLVGFFETLRLKFEEIKASLIPLHAQADVDIKCGAAIGPTLVGFMGATQTYFTAIGPEVNLAARLCSRAKGGEFVLSSRIWYILKTVGMPWAFESTRFTDLKGFDNEVGAVILRPSTSENSTHCATCGEALSVVQTVDGLFDLRCPNGHNIHEQKSQRRAG